MNEEEFENNFERALVRVAKLKAEGKGLKEILDKFIEEKDCFGVLIAGIVLGFVGADNPFIHSVWHNLNVSIKLLLDGIPEEKILEDLRKAREEAKRIFFMMYGGPA